MTFSFTWRAQSTIYRDSVDLLAVREIGGEIEVLQPVTMEIKRQGRYESIAQPSLSLAPGSARSLLQALWDAGIRPEQWEGNESQVAALKSHIAFAEKVTGALLPVVARND